MILYDQISYFCLAMCLMSRASAQNVFDWGFNDNFSGQGFAECQTLSIFVEPSSKAGNIGVAPYYMIAFEVGGVPTTTNIGNNPAQLSWQNAHRQGSSLMMIVIDSNGAFGGIPGNLYTVSPGSDTSCLPPTPTPSQIPIVIPNITDNLSTCEEWGLAISGGQQPYTVVLSALNEPVFTNITMGPTDNYLTWPNRADPDRPLMASVVDSNGKWGISSSTVQTFGPNVNATNNCGSLLPVSSFRKSTSSAGKTSQSHLALGLGVGIGAGVAVVLAVATALYLCLRRRKHQKQGVWDTDVPRPWQTPPQQPYAPSNVSFSPQYTDAYAAYTPADVYPSPYPVRELDGTSQSITPFVFKRSGYEMRDSPSVTPFMQPTVLYADGARSSTASGFFSGTDTSSHAVPRMLGLAPSVLGTDFSVSRIAGAAPPSVVGTDFRGFRMAGTVSPSVSDSRISGAQAYDPQLEAHFRKTREALEESSASVSSLSVKTPQPQPQPVAVNGDGPSGVVFQHIDAGEGPSAPMQELPPPYVDRSGGSVMDEKVS